MSDEKQISRRALFKNYFKGAVDASKEIVKEQIKRKIKRTFVRPPGAISEEMFLLTCTRCGDCAPACPHDAVHLIDELDGGVHARTPFIDPTHAPCKFCEDSPCITSCEPKSLRLLDQTNLLEDAQKYTIGIAKINADHCLITQGQRCDYYCLKSCPKGVFAISKGDDDLPVIDESACVGCGECSYICVSQTGVAIEIHPIE